jgi:serine/threonine protein kinase/Flp pilus assembly protein TadD
MSAKLSIDSIFCSAIEIESPEERRALVEQACGEDADLKQQVERLLHAHFHGRSILDTPVLPVATVDEPRRETAGAMIGAYKLLEQIGEGGFGVVFMAEQQHPVRRKVALKVLKPGTDTRQVVARFEAERQALALMDHPNIAHVFDGGETASGRPYFVMELVKGIPMTDFCDQNRLPVRERLELFVHVCQAVQHAHQKGIIHRDLKPSNVLITMHDSIPVVKVIDFGIAKAMGQPLTDKTLFTNFAQLIGTPLYMSPEQAQLSGLDIDTRSDIYSLGVLLYELLTGTTPFDQERLRRAAYDEVRRIIREEEPPKPSTRISTLGEADAIVSTNRQSDPRRLSQLMRGELDWIVMKALDKERNRRYETASAFTADIERYLHDEPVQACPPSGLYKFSKFARRNRLALAMVGLILFFILSLGAGVGWVVRDRAGREEALDDEVGRTLGEADALTQSGKWSEALAAVERVRKLLTAAGRSELPDSLLELQKDLNMVLRLEDIYSQPKQEEFWTGLEQHDAYARAFQQYGIDVTTLPRVEAAERIRARSIRRELARALDFWSFMRRRANDRKPPDWKGLLELAKAADHDDWRNQLREALERQDRKALEGLAASGDIGRLGPTNLVLLHYALVDAGALDQAVAILRRGQREYPGDFWINDALGHFYLLRVRQGQYDEALRFYSVALALRPSCPYMLHGVAEALRAKGALEEAVAAHSTVIDLKPNYAPAWNNRGAAHHQLHQYDKAIADYSKAIELDPKNRWNWNPARTTNNLAWLFATCPDARFRDAGKAVALAKKAIEMAPKEGHFWNTMGAAHYRAGNWTEAVAALEKSMGLRNGGDSFDWFFLAMAHWQLGEKEKAHNRYVQAAQWMDKNQPKNEELQRFRAEAEELLRKESGIRNQNRNPCRTEP